MTKTFENWTEYDDWLVENYSNYNIYEVNEVEGKIVIKYCDKGQLENILKEQQ